MLLLLKIGFRFERSIVTMEIAMDDQQPMGRPVTGPFFYGTGDQRRAIPQWERAGWTFLHWTEVPNMIAVLEDTLGQIIFIDQNGFAWQGPTFGTSTPVPLEKYPPVNLTHSPHFFEQTT